MEAAQMSKDTLIETQATLIKTQAKLINILELESGEILEFDEVLSRFQDNLRMLRAQVGMSQKEMSLHVDIDNGYISRLEVGKRQNPSLEIIHRLCRFYGCTFAEIMRKQ